jgi:WD40 repeat protein/uncharacterized caspase-like protein
LPDQQGHANIIVKLWDTATGILIHSFEGHATGRKCGAFSPDGASIIVTSDQTIELLDTASGAVIRSFRTNSGELQSVAYSPDGTRILSASLEGAQDPKSAGCKINLWEVASGKRILSFEAAPTSCFSTVTFSPDGERILSGGGEMKLWDAATGALIRSFVGQRPVDLLKISPDGKLILSKASNTRMTLWDADSGAPVRRIDTGAANTASFSSNGKFILSGGDDKVVKIWNSDTGHLVSSYDVPSKIEALAFSPSDTRFLSGGSNNDIDLFDTASGRLIRNFKGHVGPVNAVGFAPDGTRVISASSDHTMKSWDVASGRPLKTFAHRTEDCDSTPTIAFSRDGVQVFWAYESRRLAWCEVKISVWDVASGRSVRDFDVSSDLAAAVAYSPDRVTALSGGSRNTVEIWDLTSGREVGTLKGATGPALATAFSPDGAQYLSGSGDGGIRRWSARDKQLLSTSIIGDNGAWITVTPEGFFEGTPAGMDLLSVVQGIHVYSIDQVKQELYRPDLVREKLAGDPKGLVAAAAAKLDLTKIISSGSPPKLTVASPADRADIGGADKVTVEASLADRGGGIGRVEWRVNGVTQGILERGVALADEGAGPSDSSASPAGGAPKDIVLKRTLAVDPGDSRIEMVAFNAKNLVASEPVTITVHRDAPTAASLTKPKLHVLAVGVNDYWDGRLRLSYAAPDATAIADAFRKAGVGLYSAVDAAAVLDADATIAHLDQVFADLGKRVASGDVFVFFMAGHGKTVDGRYYFLPQDFHFRDETSIEKDGIDQKRLQAWFAEIPAKKGILLFDTCESGSLTGANVASRGLGELEAVQRLIWATGRTTLTASTDDAPAQEGYRGHGVFTYAVLAGLGEARTDKDGWIEVTDLAHYVDQAVPEISQSAFKWRQVPQMSIVGSDFPLAAKVSVLEDVAPPAAAVPLKPTHVVIAPADVFARAGGSGAVVTHLAPGTQVRLVETKDGWTLIARDGRAIGYVEPKALAGLQ